MVGIFELDDKRGRKIKLSKERWKHIREEHPEITDEEEIKRALIFPQKIILSDRDESVAYLQKRDEEIS